MWIQFSLKCPEVKKLRGECLAERAWGLAMCMSFWKINWLFCQREKYYLVPLLNHISNLITNGPLSHCACKVDLSIELVWKKASFSLPGWPCALPTQNLSTVMGFNSGAWWQESHLLAAKLFLLCRLPPICLHSSSFGLLFPSANPPNNTFFLWPNKHRQMWNCFRANPKCFKRSWK